MPVSKGGAGLAPDTAVVSWLIRAALLLVTVVTCACSSPTSPNSGPDAPPASAAPAPVSGVTGDIVTFTNQERTRGGLATLRAESRLMEAAQIHADQMARIGRMDHVLPEATYPQPEDRINAVGYRWQAFAENVAFGHRSAAEVVEAWMNSAGHRANILNATFTEIGTGFARDASGRPYYVQVFGRPRS